MSKVENLFLHDPGDGVYRLEIVPWNVPGDAIPGDEHLTDQALALVVSNARAVQDEAW